MATAKNVSLRSCTAECNCPLTPAATLTSLTVGCLGHTPGATPSQCWCGGQGRGTQAGLFLGSRGAPRMGEFGVRTPCWPWQNFKKTTLQFMTSLPPSILPSLPPSFPPCLPPNPKIGISLWQQGQPFPGPPHLPSLVSPIPLAL